MNTKNIAKNIAENIAYMKWDGVYLGLKSPLPGRVCISYVAFWKHAIDNLLKFSSSLSYFFCKGDSEHTNTCWM